MTIQVDYKQIVGAQAMSKSPAQKGMIIKNYTPDIISLHSVNARDGNETTWLRLQIPKENIDDLIQALKQFV